MRAIRAHGKNMAETQVGGRLKPKSAAPRGPRTDGRGRRDGPRNFAVLDGLSIEQKANASRNRRHQCEETELLPIGWRLPSSVGLAILIAVAGSPLPVSAGGTNLPAWLRVHAGEGEGQIAPVVLARARALYQQKLSEGAVRNPCYFAMDATRPHDLGGGRLGRRFYIICEAEGSFRAISAGHGGGRDLNGVADFSNGRRCAKNFGNAMDSELTAGGAYVTGETAASFKGYYRASAGGDAVLTRAFLKFDGEGEAANARERAIGGHAAVLLRGICRRREPQSPHADPDGYVPFGKLVNYAAGRSDGCTSWSPSDAAAVMALVKDDPTTLYIYPESRDIDAIAHAVQAGQSPSRAGLYWNATCLKEIGVPEFWRKETLEPILARYFEAHPVPPPQPPPICREP
jgi:hypothetical protein